MYKNYLYIQLQKLQLNYIKFVEHITFNRCINLVLLLILTHYREKKYMQQYRKCLTTYVMALHVYRIITITLLRKYNTNRVRL